MNIFTLTDGRRSFAQWDTGRQLIVSDTRCTEAHFCNGTSDLSIVCEVKEQGDQRVVNVPNILLQNTRAITVYAFVEEENGGYTRRAVLFPVRPRPKPEDYVYTEEERLTWASLDERIRKLEENPGGGSGGGKPFEVNLTLNVKDNGDQEFTTETTYAEIKAAMDEGREVTAVVVGAGLVLRVLQYDDSQVAFAYTFTEKTDLGTTYATMSATITADGEVVSDIVSENLVTEDYVLPVGGDELGGVKNGGNVTINADGTMTAPESSGGTVELDITLTKEGMAADAKAVGDALKEVGQPTDEQIAGAVSNWLDEHPEATTTVADGTITTEKLAGGSVTTEKLSKDIADALNLNPHVYREVNVPLVEYAYNSWTIKAGGTNNGISPTLTPQKFRFKNPSSTRVGIEIRFLDSDDLETANIKGEQELRERIALEVHGGETIEWDTLEWGRKCAKYIQLRWTNWPRVLLEVTAIYDSYVPPKPVIDAESEYLEDFPMRWMAQGHHSSEGFKRKYCIVPFYPDTDYYVRGGNYPGYDMTLPTILGLPDETFLTEQACGLSMTGGGGPKSNVHAYKGPLVSTENTELNPSWVKFRTKSWEDTVGCKYLAIGCGDLWGGHPATEVSSAEEIKAMLDDMNANGDGNIYVTRFDKRIPRRIYSRVVLANENWYDDDGSKAMAIASKSGSPLANAKWVLFGDSLTDTYGGHDLESEYFASKIAREFAMDIDNRAKSGSNIYAGGSGNYIYVNGIVMLDTYLAEIEAGTTEQADYITVAFGTNTFTDQLGTNADTSTVTTSVYGATKYFIEKIREKVPNAVLGFVLSPRQDWGTADPDGARSVDGGRTAIKAVCDEYGVPYIDMSTQSGITVAMLPDGIHISNDQSQKLYYHAMRRFMMGL